MGVGMMLKRIWEIGYRNVELLGLELAQIATGFCKNENKSLISITDVLTTLKFCRDFMQLLNFRILLYKSTLSGEAITIT
jgi:hypothetical protein